MKKSYIIVIITLILIGILFFFLYPAKFTLKGKQTYTLDYGKKYQEPGYKVEKFGKDYTKKVKIINKINYKKLGNYCIIYQVKINGVVFKTVRKIKLVDRKKPQITLNGDENTTICPNTEYNEQGYKAIDNFDGDITKNIKIIKKDNEIIYKVKDSSKNEAKVIRKIFKEDKNAPEITLKGKANDTIYLGSSWKETGFIAQDNCDNDITSSVSINGTVNTNKIGTYKIIYTVYDKSKNKAEAIRIVNVINKQAYGTSSWGAGTIFLTFDDGPKQGTTDVILDILKEEKVPATFFVTNNGPDFLIKREYDEGHTVGLHTASHNYAVVYKSVDSYYNDLKQVQDRVKNITGYESKIIRFPGGSSNTVSRHYTPGIMSYLTKDVVNKGFKYYDWNISSGDAGGVSTADGVYNNVIKYLSKNKYNMILMHDIKPYTRDALKRIIKYGKNNGYTFSKITANTPIVSQHVNN